MSCANTSLPWFIDPPRAMLPRGVAKPKFEIQIETKKINRLCVFHQQLTGAESPNVGTLLIFLIDHVRSLPAALRVLTSPRSCCAKCPIRQRKPESGVGERKGCKSIVTRNARHAPRYILQISQPTNEAAWACESPSRSRPKGSPGGERKSMLRAGARCTLC